MSRRRKRALVAIVAVALVGSGMAIGGTVRERTPDYERDIGPILARHCLDCHRAEGVAPQARLDDERSATQRAESIRRSVASRMMPPFVADNTGYCGEWRDPRWLSTEEVRTVLRWTESRERIGGGAADRRIPWSPGPSPSFRSDATVDIGGVYEPGLGTGGYRCFVADPGLADDRFLRAIRVDASDPRGLTQLNLFALDSPEAEAEVTALDQADAPLGYPCYGSPRTKDARLVVGWTAGSSTLRIGDDVGVRLHARRKVVIQVRYNVLAPGREYKSALRLGLELAEHAREARVVPIRADGVLPPRAVDVRLHAELPLTRPVTVLGMTPWMHMRGKFMQVHAERPGSNTCLATFDHWIPRYAQTVVATTPRRLESGDRLSLQCAFQTLGTAQTIATGDTIEDEECVVQMLLLDD